VKGSTKQVAKEIAKKQQEPVTRCDTLLLQKCFHLDGTLMRIIMEEAELAGLTTISTSLETVRSREETWRFLKPANNLPSKI
jgi:hypothetical protein